MNDAKQSGQDHDEDKPLEELLAEMEAAEVSEAVEIDIDTLFADIFISARDGSPYRAEATAIHGSSTAAENGTSCPTVLEPSGATGS